MPTNVTLHSAFRQATGGTFYNGPDGARRSAGFYFRRKNASTSRVIAVIHEPTTRIPTLTHFCFVQSVSPEVKNQHDQTEPRAE